MTYKEAWEAIYFRHCEETCDYAYMDNCQEGKCEYYMALQALNRQYYAECGSVWTKPLADRKTEPQTDCADTNLSEKPTGSTRSKMEQVDKDINVRSKTEPQTEIKVEPTWVGTTYGRFETEPQTERSE